MKMNDRRVLLFLHKDRTAIASPTAVCWVGYHINALQVRAGAGQIIARRLFLCPAIDEESPPFTESDVPPNRPINPSKGIQLAGPIRGIVWPAQPGCLMFLP